PTNGRPGGCGIGSRLAVAAMDSISIADRLAWHGAEAQPRTAIGLSERAAPARHHFSEPSVLSVGLRPTLSMEISSHGVTMSNAGASGSTSENSSCSLAASPVILT